MIDTRTEAPIPVGARPRVVALAIVAGSVAGAAVLGAEALGILTGPILIGFGALVALAVPASRELSRRVLLLACFLLGWMPMMWWFPLELPGFTRIGLAVALLVGVLTGLLVRGRVRPTALVPRLRLADIPTLLAGVLATAMAWPLVAVGDGAAALRMLRGGWDYAAHFNMAEMIRRTGSLTAMASPGPLGDWSYADYPKGFHAVVATIMEATVGAEIAAPGAELVGFAHATALVAIVAVTMVAAGVASIPSVRRKPLLAALLVGLVFLALMLGPDGEALLRAGFPNFLLATCLLAAIPIIVVSLGRVASIAPLLALSGALVGIAHNWALMLFVALAALLPALLPLRRRRWPSSAAGWTGLLLVIGMTALGGLAAWLTLRSGLELSSVLLIPGGFVGGSLSEKLLSPVAAIVLCAAVGWLALRRRSPDGRGVRTGAEALMPLAGLGLLAYVAFVLVSAGRPLDYYFYKLGAGLQLASVVLVAVAFAELVRLSRSRRRRRVIIAGAAVFLIALLGTSSGVLSLSNEAVAIRSSPGLQRQIDWYNALNAPSPESVAETRELLLAAEAATGDAPHFWIPAELNGSTAPRLSNQWLFAMTGQWATSSYDVVDAIWGDAVPVDQRPGDLTEAVRKIQEASPAGIIVIPPEALKDLDDAPGLESGHIISW